MKKIMKEYKSPVATSVDIELNYFIAFSTNDDQVDPDGGDGGWAKEQVGGSWEDIWNAQ